MAFFSARKKRVYAKTMPTKMVTTNEKREMPWAAYILEADTEARFFNVLSRALKALVELRTEQGPR